MLGRIIVEHDSEKHTATAMRRLGPTSEATSFRAMFAWTRELPAGSLAGQPRGLCLVECDKVRGALRSS